MTLQVTGILFKSHSPGPQSFYIFRKAGKIVILFQASGISGWIFQRCGVVVFQAPECLMGTLILGLGG